MVSSVTLNYVYRLITSCATLRDEKDWMTDYTEVSTVIEWIYLDRNTTFISTASTEAMLTKFESKSARVKGKLSVDQNLLLYLLTVTLGLVRNAGNGIKNLTRYCLLC